MVLIVPSKKWAPSEGTAYPIGLWKSALAAAIYFPALQLLANISSIGTIEHCFILVIPPNPFQEKETN